MVKYFWKKRKFFDENIKLVGFEILCIFAVFLIWFQKVDLSQMQKKIESKRANHPTNQLTNKLIKSFGKNVGFFKAFFVQNLLDRLHHLAVSADIKLGI